MPRYEQYLLQTGGGLTDLGQVYRGNSWGAYQRGRGLGDFFSSVYRMIQPYLASGAKAITTELARGGAEVLGNLGSQPISELMRQQRDKSLQNLATKASNKLKRVSIGSGIKRRATPHNALTGGRIKRRRKAVKTPSRRRAAVGKTSKKRRPKSASSIPSSFNLTGGRVKKRNRRRKKQVKRKIQGRRRKRQTGGSGSKKKPVGAFLRQFLRKQ